MHLQILPNVRNRGSYDLDWIYVSILQRCKWQLLMSGEAVILYQRKWTGIRCDCWDPVRMQASVDSPCSDCFGVGYKSGYYRPLTIYVSLLSPVQIQNVVQEEGVRKSFKPTSWSLHEPTFKNGDFIVRQNGERHWIVDVNPTRWRSKILRQLFSTDEVERNHPIYTIPV